MFEDADFQKGLEESFAEADSSWELFVEKMGFIVHKRPNKAVGDGSLNEYRAVGKFDTVDAETLFKVLQDLKYRETWDANIIEWKVVNPETKCMYYVVKYPFPLSYRDYVYHLEGRNLNSDPSNPEKNAFVILGKSAPNSSHVPSSKSSYVRINDYYQFMVVKPQGKGCSVFMRYFDNPGGSIPTWVINWVASSGVPAFLKSLETACQKYDAYLKGKK
eukprot:Colp12_sorted_trinity150504_noHs@25560